MNKSNRWNGARTALLLCVVSIASGQTFTTLVNFGNGTVGNAPDGALVQGTDGNFYGTTESGGAHGGGTIFKLTPSGAITTLYSFCSLPSCADGSGPLAGLIQASDGNFYGTTYYYGGAGGQYAGTVFKITAGGTLTTLHSFCSLPSCADGSLPLAGLIQASDGNFYGTTMNGGAPAGGTIFKISPGGTLTTMHSFDGSDGAAPEAGLIQASDGNFYGTTYYGGAANGGTVFKMTAAGTFTTLHSFCLQAGCPDGNYPHAGLTQVLDGRIYGTTYGGGVNTVIGGTVFKITPGGTLTTLYSFCSQSNCSDGIGPLAGLIQATDGNLYGTTSGGGISGGTVFKMTPGDVLTTFNDFDETDGSDSRAGLIQASDGNFYGTTELGGTSNDGTVFRLAFATASAAPAINQTGGVVNGASFLSGISPNTWITIFGTNLSPVTDTWVNAIVNGNLPTTLDGVSVSVGGQPAYIYSISPTQINALAPDFGPGTVTVTNSGETSAAVSAATPGFTPAFFLWPGNYAVATRQDYSLAVKNGTFASTTTTPAKPGDVIILWGTGFGPTTPAAPVGVETPSLTTYNTTYPVTVTAGGVPATVYGAALAAGNAGLYQVAIQIPTSLANGDYPIVATIGNQYASAKSPSTTLITVEN